MSTSPALGGGELRPETARTFRAGARLSRRLEGPGGEGVPIPGSRPPLSAICFVPYSVTSGPVSMASNALPGTDLMAPSSSLSHAALCSPEMNQFDPLSATIMP